MHRRLLLTLIVLAPFTIASSPADATYGVDEWRQRIWMAPPMDTVGDNACLTNSWHGSYDDANRALDWQSACGENTSKDIRFRLWAASPDNCCTTTVFAWGEPVQMDPIACGSGENRYARVRIRSLWDGQVKGKATYQHAVVDSTSTIDIVFKENAWLTGAEFNNATFAHTVNDSGGCWTGFHVHENNSDDSPMYWDDWNTLYNSPSFCDCYKNNDRDNWIRRMHWVDD